MAELRNLLIHVTHTAQTETREFGLVERLIGCEGTYAHLDRGE